MATLMGANETLKVGRSLGVSAIVDSYWTPGRGVVPGLGKVSPWVTYVGPINLLDRLTLLGLAVETDAGGRSWRADYQQPG